ncbi:permease [Paenibacillus lycopersici]|uniref:Permease n=1 Tax=Paenibacillus lycopersici TaxID=2704462 RepID=A0A6C0G029_9BACL|nr:permease [Paenibacillus lycopersici]QHT61091.1 permease [Paenibacillus lycopersici]
MEIDDRRRSTWKINLVFGFIFGFIVILFLKPTFIVHPSLPDLSGLNTFKTMFVSIVLEAMPFILISVFVSSLMQVLLPEGWIGKVIPRNPLLGVLIACLLGIVFPVCECGLIPIVRRLIAKGLPLYAGVVFILVGPIVNPIVYSATFNAFRTRPEMLYGRIGVAMTVGIATGLFVHFVVKGNQLKIRPESLYADMAKQNRTTADTSFHIHKRGRMFAVLNHAGGELFDMGGYLIFGAVVTAAIQSLLPRAELVGIAQTDVGSHLFMMGFAFVLSLCSTSDAFVASSFAGTFSAGSLIAFLVFGPMMNVKGILMLLTTFKTRFVMLLIVLVAAIVLAGSMVAEHLIAAYN